MIMIILFMNHCFIVYIRTMKGVGPFWPIHTGASGVGSPCDCVNFSYGLSKPESQLCSIHISGLTLVYMVGVSCCVQFV